MSTFSQDNYLPIIFYLNGEWEKDEPFDYKKWIKDTEVEREDYLHLLSCLSGEERDEVEKAIHSLDMFRALVKKIWDPKYDEYTENYE